MPSDNQPKPDGFDEITIHLAILEALADGVDPMTGEEEWGKRSWQDDWDADSWGGENLFDVYSLSEGVGMNGVPYSEW